MANEGCILIARSILESQVFASDKELKIWVWLLVKCNWKKRFTPFKIGNGYTSVEVDRGQMIFGRYKAEYELNIDGSTVYKILQRMQERGDIIIESNSHYSLITVCNYEQYQNIDTYRVATEEQPGNSKVTAKEQPGNTPNKENTLKKVKKENNKEFDFFSDHSLCQFTDGQEIIFRQICDEYLKNHLRVQSLTKPLTSHELFKLIKKHGKQNTLDTLDNMENWKPLTSKSISAYSTANNWIKGR